MNSGPGEEERVRSRNDLNSARYINFKFQNGLRTSIEFNEGIFQDWYETKSSKKTFRLFHIHSMRTAICYDKMTFT